MRLRDIKVGTSGWRFADWAGVFYPLRIPQAQWLEYYAARFPVGEVNSTYYRIPTVRSFAAMATKTPGDFEFIVKVHGEVTHRRESSHTAMHNLLTAVAPLREAGKLRGFLAQFPASFRFCVAAGVYVRALRDLCDGVPLYVEFRHRSWEHPDALSAIREAGIAWVSTDEPELDELMSRNLYVSEGTLYLRLHGRNSRSWYDRSAGDRYDYSYSEQELTYIGQALREAAKACNRAFVLFNNCYAGQAPQNAWWLKTWLETTQD